MTEYPLRDYRKHANVLAEPEEVVPLNTTLDALKDQWPAEAPTTPSPLHVTQRYGYVDAQGSAQEGEAARPKNAMDWVRGIKVPPTPWAGKQTRHHMFLTNLPAITDPTFTTAFNTAVQQYAEPWFHQLMRDTLHATPGSLCGQPMVLTPYQHIAYAYVHHTVQLMLAHPTTFRSMIPRGRVWNWSTGAGKTNGSQGILDACAPLLKDGYTIYFVTTQDNRNNNTLDKLLDSAAYYPYFDRAEFMEQGQVSKKRVEAHCHKVLKVYAAGTTTKDAVTKVAKKSFLSYLEFYNLINNRHYNFDKHIIVLDEAQSMFQTEKVERQGLPIMKAVADALKDHPKLQYALIFMLTATLGNNVENLLKLCSLTLWPEERQHDPLELEKMVEVATQTPRPGALLKFQQLMQARISFVDTRGLVGIMPQLSIVLENITSMSTRTEWDAQEGLVVTTTVPAPSVGSASPKARKPRGTKQGVGVPLRKRKKDDPLSHEEQYRQDYANYQKLLANPPKDTFTKKGMVNTREQQLDKALNKVRATADVDTTKLMLTLGRCRCKYKCAVRHGERVFETAETIALISSKLPHLLKNIRHHPHDKHYIYSQFPAVGNAIACMLTHMEGATLVHFDTPPQQSMGKNRKIRPAHVRDYAHYQGEVAAHGRPYLLSLFDLKEENKEGKVDEKKRRVDVWNDKVHVCKGPSSDDAKKPTSRLPPPQPRRGPTTAVVPSLITPAHDVSGGEEEEEEEEEELEEEDEAPTTVDEEEDEDN
jgi:hypothetical protein